MELSERFFEAFNVCQPVLLHNPFLHQVPQDSDCPPLAVFLNGALVQGGWRRLIDSPVTDPGALLGIGIGNGMCVFEATRYQEVETGGMLMAHGYSIPFHMVDFSWLALIPEEERPVVRPNLVLPDKLKGHSRF